jgi:hypothetical protein
MQARKNIWEYYDVLGLRPGASTAEIKHAYRRLVRQWHPDRFTHDPRSQRVAEEKLKEINEAYGAVSGARPSTPYTPPYQYRPAHTTQQRASGSYSHSRSTYTQANSRTTGERRRASDGFRQRSAYDSPYYTYREVSPRQTPKWLVILAWLFVVGITNMLDHRPTETVELASMPAWSEPQITYTPPNYDAQHLADLQKQAQDAMNVIRLNDRRRRLNFPPTVPLDERVASILKENANAQVQAENQAQTQGQGVSLGGSQEKPAVRNYPAPPTKWPGFTPSVETSNANAPSQENTTPSPTKEKVVFPADPRQ